MENDDLKAEDLPDDLTPFITRIIQDRVAVGGYGDVWKCHYDKDDISAFVAVKAFRLPEDCDLETINRKIRREIGILKVLRHINIVPLWGIAIGFGLMPELRCLVSPWMPNGTLSVYLASNHDVLTVLDRSRMLEDVSAGLRYLHSKLVMHGDITGANILIDKGGHARLIDFGLSTIVQPLGQSHLAATSIGPGAIRYAAPELVLSEDDAYIGPLDKPDIYSFGCVMLQVLSGRLPWSEIKSRRLTSRITLELSAARGPQRPCCHPEIIDSDWKFIQKCLQFGPELRPTADEVLEFVMHRFSSPDSGSRPSDDPPDDEQGDFPGAFSHRGSGEPDVTEQSPNIPPPHPDHELRVLSTSMENEPSHPDHELKKLTISMENTSLENDDLRAENLPDDLTPFLTRTTRDYISGGGFGDVWKCNYNRDDISALVAVKAFRLPGDYDLETINRKITREISTLKILRHNNIVPLWGMATGFGRVSGLHCLISPWMPNDTLNTYLASYHNKLTVLDRSRLLEDVSAGLHYLHSVHVVHGNITGANILIDKRGHARLIDFGLSTIVQPLLDQSYLARSSIRPGAIRYAAPEFVLPDNARELPPLEKADIYSVGCIMLQILSGRLPWSEIRGETPIIATISQGCGPQRPDGHPAIIDLDWNFIQSCLQFRPELRPSAEEVLEFVMHRFSLPAPPGPHDGPPGPPDDPPDDGEDGSPGAPLHSGSGSSDATEKPPNSPPGREPKPSISLGPRIHSSHILLPRTALNDEFQKIYGNAMEQIRWEVYSEGPPKALTWHATLYIDDMIYGYGTADTRDAAKDMAATTALGYLRREGR